MLAHPDKLVLIPPMGGDERCWDFIEFSSIGVSDSSIQKYVYPGHGEVPRQPGMTFATMADEVARQFPGPFHLVAIAAGVAVAAQFITRHPGRIASAVFVCAGFSPRQHGAELEASLRRAEKPVREGMSSVVEEMITRWFTPWGRASGNPGVAYSRACLEAMDPQGWRDIWLAVSQREDVPDEVTRSITVPVSLVASLNDPTGGVKNTQTLHALLPNSRLEYLSGPHMLHLERPAEVLAALERHLLWVSTGGGRVERPMFFTTD